MKPIKQKKNKLNLMKTTIVNLNSKTMNRIVSGMEYIEYDLEENSATAGVMLDTNCPVCPYNLDNT